jgi:CMP-N-acetylneuraminic acid synthetase
MVPVYAEVSAAYVFRKDVFTRLNRRIGEHPYLCEVSGIECVDIDYPEDFTMANALYKELLS